MSKVNGRLAVVAALVLTVAASLGWFAAGVAEPDGRMAASSEPEHERVIWMPH